MSINEAITKVIQENLPAATAGELKKYFDEADKTKESLGHIKKLYDDLMESFKRHTELVDKLQKDASKHNNLIEREKAIIVAENNLKLVITENKVIEAEKRADAIYRLAETAFKNRSITRMVSTSVPVYQPYPGGGGQFSTVNGSEYHTEGEIESDPQ